MKKKNPKVTRLARQYTLTISRRVWRYQRGNQNQ